MRCCCHYADADICAPAAALAATRGERRSCAACGESDAPLLAAFAAAVSCRTVTSFRAPPAWFAVLLARSLSQA